MLSSLKTCQFNIRSELYELKARDTNSSIAHNYITSSNYHHCYEFAVTVVDVDGGGDSTCNRQLCC